VFEWLRFELLMRSEPVWHWYEEGISDPWDMVEDKTNITEAKWAEIFAADRVRAAWRKRGIEQFALYLDPVKGQHHRLLQSRPNASFLCRTFSPDWLEESLDHTIMVRLTQPNRVPHDECLRDGSTFICWAGPKLLVHRQYDGRYIVEVPYSTRFHPPAGKRGSWIRTWFQRLRCYDLRILEGCSLENTTQRTGLTWGQVRQGLRRVNKVMHYAVTMDWPPPHEAFQ
jgi:hypothetical protein